MVKFCVIWVLEFYLGDTNLFFYDQSQKIKGYNLDYKHYELAKFGDKNAKKMNFKLLPSSQKVCKLNSKLGELL